MTKLGKEMAHSPAYFHDHDRLDAVYYNAYNKEYYDPSETIAQQQHYHHHQRIPPSHTHHNVLGQEYVLHTPSSSSSSPLSTSPEKAMKHEALAAPAVPPAAFMSAPLAADTRPVAEIHSEDGRGRRREENQNYVKKTKTEGLGRSVYSPSSPGSSPRGPGGARRRGDVDLEEGLDEEEDEEEEGRLRDAEDENAVIVLLRLTFFVPPISFLSAFYTIFVLLFLTFVSPLRFCPPSNFFKPPSTFSSQICSLLGPLLRVHQGLISQHRTHQHTHTPHHRITPHTHNHTHTIHDLPAASSSPSPARLPTTSSTSPAGTNQPSTSTPPVSTSALAQSISTPNLLLIHLLSPLLSIPLLFAAWIAAFFWVFAMILGNPDGTEKRDDGRVAVLGVRGWWRSWLGRARRRRRKKRKRGGKGRGK